MVELDHTTLGRCLFLDISDLICGQPIVDVAYESDLPGLVLRLRSDLEEIDAILMPAAWTPSGFPEWAVLPFLMRKFLELSATGLLARVDPLRVLAARKNQLHSSYELGRQNASSIAWTGDIFPSDKTPACETWDSATLKKGPERSLLGWHVGSAAIAPGLIWLTDVATPESVWLTELANQKEPFDWIRGRLGQLYSNLSKGVHAEYLLDDRVAFDPMTIKQHLNDVYMLVLVLAAASHASPLFTRSLERDAALRALLDLEKTVAEKMSQK